MPFLTFQRRRCRLGQSGGGRGSPLHPRRGPASPRQPVRRPRAAAVAPRGGGGKPPRRRGGLASPAAAARPVCPVLVLGGGDPPAAQADEDGPAAPGGGGGRRRAARGRGRVQELRDGTAGCVAAPPASAGSSGPAAANRVVVLEHEHAAQD